MEKIRVNTGENPYNILFGLSYGELPSALEEIGAPKKLLAVTDSNVFGLWYEKIEKILTDSGYEVHVHVLPAGEENKNIDGVLGICRACIEHGLDRKSMILAVGGGVVGDMAGFAAAMYMRGIRFVQIPTTLLSQSDSSVGGKTGVDFEGVKNIIGAFHQPSLVYINPETLKTLPEAEFRSGMGEVIKHGIIRDEEFFEFLYDNSEDIKALKPDIMLKTVMQNCKIKAAVVETDEKEQGLRAILNFGHTIGHAVESAENFSKTHGECVALGMCAAAHIAKERGMLSNADFEKIGKIIKMYGFNTGFSADNETVERLIKLDKKSIGGKVGFVLPKKIGEVTRLYDVEENEISKSLDSIRSF